MNDVHVLLRYRQRYDVVNRISVLQRNVFYLVHCRNLNYSCIQTVYDHREKFSITAKCVPSRTLSKSELFMYSDSVRSP